MGDPPPNASPGGRSGFDTTTHSISYAFAIAGQSALTPDPKLRGQTFKGTRVPLTLDQGSSLAKHDLCYTNLRV